MSSLRATFLALACVGLSTAVACLPDQETIQKIGDCAGPGVGDLMTTVQTLLFKDGSGDLSGEVVAELERLGKQHGIDLVTCLIDRFIFDARSQPAASTDPATLAAARRGEAFNASH